MSDSLAIAAVTNALVHVLQRGFAPDPDGFDTFGGDVRVTTQPPDKVQAGGSHKINLFLYQANLNPSWRNMDLPWQTRPGETKPTPLPLDLHYLITVHYGESEESVHTDVQGALLGSHRLLGRAMGILHDHPILSAAEINDSLPEAERERHPYSQMETVRITPQPLSLDELSKIWTGFQTQYRLSAAYEASVVLIESTRPARAPLPVLRRGPEDEGVKSLLGPFPVLEEIRRPAATRPGIQLGDLIEILGQNLPGEDTCLTLQHARLPKGYEQTVEAGSTTTRLQVQLPSPASLPAGEAWPAGFYQVATLQRCAQAQPEKASNQLPLLIAPTLQPLTFLAADNQLARDNQGSLTLPIEATSEVLPEQGASVLVGSHALSVAPHATATSRLVFEGMVPATDDFLVVRLRVDGVDSLAFKQDDAGLTFDPAQKLRLLPSLIVRAEAGTPLITNGEKDVPVTVTVANQVQPGQQVSLALGGTTLPAVAVPGDRKVTFTLTVPKELESAVVRLLVDGAEEPRARQTADGFILNPGHKVKLT